MYKIITMFKNIIFLILAFLLLFTNVNSEILNRIEISGNQRISNETIKVFADIKINENYDQNRINNIVKDLYETDFFEDVKINFSENILKIVVVENSIIQSLNITSVKNKDIIKTLKENISLQEKSSFVKNKVKRDEITIQNILKSNGYYFSEIVTKVKQNDNNTVDLTFDVNLGEKAYIYNIKFIGDKKIKDRKLKSVIVSEESKFWKFISNRKFLDQKRIKLDEKLLRNYYKNNGYYNVKINSTFAQIVNQNQFELVFNIDAGKKYYFNNLSLQIPDSFDKENFSKMNKILSKLQFQQYSLNKIKKVLDEVDEIVLKKQYQFINATYNEKVVDNKIDLIFKIKEGQKLYVEKINIIGNYITNENVIRNSIITDEGDPFNDILFKKSIDNIKSRNIFSEVNSSIENGSSDKYKIININVEEKPTGEVAAGAGTGTSGSAITFSIAENNYLGVGTRLKANTTISDESIEALFSIQNPNFRNTDRSLNTTIETTKNDLMSKFGYETTKTGFSLGTSFEQYQNVYFTPTISSYFETLDTSSKASKSKRKQEGDYFDTNFSYRINLNRLNQNFQPTDGYKSSFFQQIPVVADDKSIINAYEFAKYKKLRNEAILSFNFFAKAVNSFDDDVRVSKRVFIPQRKLRGFSSGKVGPKDSGDYIGGNYGSALNVATTLPKLFTDLQNIDFNLFFDAANVFGVDYDSSLDSNKIRSSTGLAVDWFTPIGPLSFSLATPITKASTDETESFRFQIGTSF